MNKKKKNRQPLGATLRPLTQLTQLGLTILSPIGLCIFMGSWLDKKLGTDPWCVCIGVVIGIGSGYKAMFDVLRRYMKPPEDDRN